MDERAADVSNGGDAEAQNVVSWNHRITLKVPAKPTFGFRDGELVIRFGEVIHPDRLVSRAEKLLAHDREELDFDLARRELRLIELFLMALHPRDVSEGVARDPVGRYLKHPIDGRLESLGRLERETINEVRVDTTITAAPPMLHEGLCLLGRLNAMHALLDFGREVLDAHRHPVEAELGERVEMLEAGDAGVDLDSHLGAFDRLVLGEDGFHECFQLFGAVVSGRPSSEMKLGKLPPFPHALGEELDFAAHQLEIGRGALVIRADDDVTAAKQTLLVTKRKMPVKRQRRVRTETVGLGQALFVDILAHFIRELDGGGVARIARPRPVVFRDELLDGVAVERSMFHVSLKRDRRGPRRKRDGSRRKGRARNARHLPPRKPSFLEYRSPLMSRVHW